MTSRATEGTPAGTRFQGEPPMLLHKVLSLVLQENLVSGILKEGDKVVQFVDPQHLQPLLDLELGVEGCNVAQVESLLDRVVQYSVRTQHPHFYNQLYGGIDEVALAGAWLAEALNTNLHTFEVAPVFVLMERYVIGQLLKLFGCPSNGEGIFSPGGSLSNMYGMVLARHHRYPDVKRLGLFGHKPLIILTSDQSHYSVRKGAAWLGHGLDNVVSVPTDAQGRMTASALRQAVRTAREAGGDPFFVAATSGTTVLGSFDPLDDLAEVCQEEGLWLHVDACWGGTAIMSEHHTRHLRGIQRADSLAWNPHKMLGVSLQCSVFLVKHQGLLLEANSSNASYLFQVDKFYDVSFDTGDKSIQCGRKLDVFKLWLFLKVHGLKELMRRVDNAFDVARYLSEQVNCREGFLPVLGESQCTNVCFWYVPPSLRGQEQTNEWWQKIAQVAPVVKERMVKGGHLMVGYNPLPEKGLVNFFRMVLTCQPEPTHEHMDYVLDQIHSLGQDL